MISNDSIAAIATAAGAGGIGVIRVSGKEALPLARALLNKEPKHRFAHRVVLPDVQGRALDDGLLLAFPAPHSFTGEDVVELHGHGAPVVLELLLRMLEARGIRRARPGEFSQRAFINGKLDLIQAEAIADLIASQSERGARAALRSLQGAFSERVQTVLQRLIQTRVWIEAALDFPDEEIDFLADTELLALLEQLRQNLDALIFDAEVGQRVRDGLYVVIVGAPNAGKSSLLNHLAGHESAIVSDIAGTTRDVLREQIEIAGVAVTLVDTAGLRESIDSIERIGIARARAEVRRADLALVLRALDGDGSAALTVEHELPPDVPRIHVLSKIDLCGESLWRASLQPGELPLSVRTGQGVEELKAAMVQGVGIAEGSEGGFSARARHTAALREVRTHCSEAATLLARRQGELAAEELRLAQSELAGITGEFTADDLLGKIFGSFCIGK